jgi:DNA-binding transcriptional LysR family regulator
MASLRFLFCAMACFIATAGLPVHVSFSATLEDALKSLKGLAAKERQPRVESEARKEGIVRWASSTPQAWAEPSLQAFRKRYPGIQIEYMRQSGRVLAERIVREYRAGKHDIDIVGTSAVTFAAMKDAA